MHVINFKRKIIVVSQTFVTFLSDDSAVLSVFCEGVHGFHKSNVFVQR